LREKLAFFDNLSCPYCAEKIDLPWEAVNEEREEDRGNVKMHDVNDRDNQQ